MAFWNKKASRLQIQSETEYELRKFSNDKLEDVFTLLHCAREGLSSEEAEERLDRDGQNVIVTGKKDSVLRRLAGAFINPFNTVLFAVAIISFVTDVLMPSRTSPSQLSDYTTVLIILFLIFLSGIVSFAQAQRSNSAAAALSKMISNKVDAFRDGKLTEIGIEEVVEGDVVKLSAGDMIPGDVRFIWTKDAFISQAALTGEANPVEKFSEQKENSESLTDAANLGFMGSDVVSGSALGLVLFTGNRTYFGSMAESLSGDRAKNSFERGVDSVSSLLLRFMLVMVPIVFVINGISKHDWGSSLLFAVSIAIGLTPEMLPVIMSSTLAKGAVSMSRQKTIVKTLSAIQTFGEIDVLCTDKTGTLTEDKIVLEKYMDVRGNDDARVLRHAYLNSHYQTGLKNLIDLAIISRASENGLDNLTRNYTRVDEIPFDFARRRMSVVLVDRSGKRQLITKGAVEEILSICSLVEYNGRILPLDEKLKAEALSVYEKHNKDGLRVLAVAQKNNVAGIETFGVKDESEMVLLGFVGFLDPPKESSAAAISALKEHGIRVVVLTGDSEGVAVKVCKKVGVNTEKYLLGKDVEKMNYEALQKACKTCDLFAKLSPAQKQRVVTAFQANGHTVGYMGDGINDAQSLRQADVGISVDSAVDIAKETADIILLEKDLMVLEKGVVEGRRTFGNIVKYINMAVSGNFGNMLSVIVASVFLPFLPLLPVHILTQNLLCDFSQMGIPFDRVDREYIARPRKWDASSIKRFMFVMGPLSSLFDILCFIIMYFVFKANSPAVQGLFQCAWFAFGTISQILIVNMIRTRKIPFVQSRPSLPLVLSGFSVIAVTLLIAFIAPLARGLELIALPLGFVPWLLLLLAGYCLLSQLIKNMYVRRFGEWL
ncbi:MAG: magnesium-translocating P-type ATPase [Oscillospiraceae bacterium]|jgi:Mg2+-importing ATPase|nr:magnesium-translocating P-type ATPase [Oscillospiraceae bacterium]